ncbi:MAG: hypothetical protein HPY74_12325 [Firmicutes bacterium]|nr:hypothetical protein [Bacillota bacterium]
MQSNAVWIRETCESGRAVIVLDVSGVENLHPNTSRSYSPLDFYGIIFKLTHDLMWLGDRMAVMRTYDVIRGCCDVIRVVDVVAHFPEICETDIHLYGYGRYGLYAQLAAALDEWIKKVEIREGIYSFTQLVKARHNDQFNIFERKAKKMGMKMESIEEF